MTQDQLPGPAELAEAGSAAAGPAVIRCWEGPVNLRALAQAASLTCPADRDWLDGRLAADRGGNYARAVALMRAVNGERDRDALTWRAALSSELTMPATFASTFLDLLDRAGWTRESAPGDD